MMGMRKDTDQGLVKGEKFCFRNLKILRTFGGSKGKKEKVTNR